MISHDKNIPRKKSKKQAKNTKSEKDGASPLEEVCTYGIECLNLEEPANDLESASESENESKQADELVI